MPSAVFRSLPNWLVAGLITAIVGAAVSVAFLAFRQSPYGGWDVERQFGLPALYRLRGAQAPPREVVVVAIDSEASAALKLPNRPAEWPRSLHAELVEGLARQGAALVIFDLFFARSKPLEDQTLADAMRRAGNVVLVDQLEPEIERRVGPVAQLRAAARASAPFVLPREARVDEFWTFRPAAGPTPTLPVSGLVHLSPVVFSDLMGIAQQLDSTGRLGKAAGGSVGTEQNVGELRRWLLADAERPTRLRDALHDHRIEARQPTSVALLPALIDALAGEELRYLNFYGPPRTVTTVAYHEALALLRDPSAGNFDFRGKTVFVGFSPASARDYESVRDDYHTVYSDSNGMRLSGVEIAATAFANLQNQRTLGRSGALETATLAALWGLFIGWLGRGRTLRIAPIFAVIAGAIYVAVAVYLFAVNAIWLPLIVPLGLQIPLAMLLLTLLNYAAVRRERTRIRKAFGYFVPNELVNRLAEGRGTVMGQHKAMFGVCLYSDAERYSALAEAMAPEPLSAYINEYFGVIFPIIERHGGIVSDVEGDAMMALWAGAEEDSTLCTRACASAIALQSAVAAFNASHPDAPLPTRVGIHAGPIALGTIGASQHYEYRAVGEIVNTANRIQSLNKSLGTGILVSGEVVSAVEVAIARPLGQYLLSGKSKPVAIFEISVDDFAGPAGARSRAEIFARGQRLYSAGDLAGAKEIFDQCLVRWPHDSPSRFFAERCNVLLSSGARGKWDPVVIMNPK